MRCHCFRGMEVCVNNKGLLRHRQKPGTALDSLGFKYQLYTTDRYQIEPPPTTTSNGKNNLTPNGMLACLNTISHLHDQKVQHFLPGGALKRLNSHSSNVQIESHLLVFNTRCRPCQSVSSHHHNAISAHTPTHVFLPLRLTLTVPRGYTWRKLRDTTRMPRTTARTP